MTLINIYWEKFLKNIYRTIYQQEKINLWSIVSAVTNYSTLRNNKGLNGHGISTSSLNVGVSRQENVASWLTNIVAPFAENRLAGGLV